MPQPKPRLAHTFERDPDEHYCEENWVSDRLFQEERFTGTILDPACGWGRILLAARANGVRAIGSDIVDRRKEAAANPLAGVHDLWKTMPRDNFRQLDFLKAVHPEETYAWWRQAGGIVTNPPFSMLRDVVARATALAPKVAVLCELRKFRGATWLAEVPLAKVWLLSPRPSMPTGAHILKGGRVGGGFQDFCWLIMKRGWDKAPTIDWLHRDP